MSRTFMLELERARARAPYTMSHLVAEAARLIPLLRIEQKRYRVTEFPDERTIRFYLGRGLVSRPVERRGGTGLFPFRALLQVLAVKKLQSGYLPLRKIEEVMRHLDDEGLEQLLRRETEERWMCEERLPAAEEMPAVVASIPLRALESVEMAPRSIVEEPSAAEEEEVGWVRAAVGEGVELHIRSDSPAGCDREGRQRLVAQVRVCVAKHLEKRRWQARQKRRKKGCATEGEEPC